MSVVAAANSGSAQCGGGLYAARFASLRQYGGRPIWGTTNMGDDMHTRNAKPQFGSTSMRRLRTLVLAVAVLSGGTIAVSGNSAFSAGPPTDDTVPAFALRWFAQLQDGRID